MKLTNRIKVMEASLTSLNDYAKTMAAVVAEKAPELEVIAVGMFVFVGVGGSLFLTCAQRNPPNATTNTPPAQLTTHIIL